MDALSRPPGLELREMLEDEHKNSNPMIIKAVSYKEAARAETVFLSAFQNNPVFKQEFFSYLGRTIQRVLREFTKREFQGEESQTASLWLAQGRPRRIVLFGLGKKDQWHERKFPLLARRFVQYARKERIKNFAALLSTELARDPLPASARFAAESLAAQFEFTAYKSEKDNGKGIDRIQLTWGNTHPAGVEEALYEGTVIGEEVNLCRELANTPGSDMTPSLLAQAAERTASPHNISVLILDRREMETLGMGAVLGVARGSVEEPKFIVLEYFNGPKEQKPLVLAGKGVTFDTGGINLKSDQHILDMHMDMSGGAAVIHGIISAARMNLPVNIVGLIPAVENMPSGSSYRPGDLLKSLSGKTIEVLNTDAEGRVILADALTYGLRYKPEIMIDFATLTGAAHVALGSYCSALFTQDGNLQKDLVEIGRQSGDYIWPMPLWDEYLADIKGTFGDLANIGKGDRYGGAIHGAKFLEQFAGDTRFAHIDIAPRMTATDTEYLAKGATGVGVRFIAQLGKEYPQLLKAGYEIRNDTNT